jgi:hypothetical protein
VFVGHGLSAANGPPANGPPVYAPVLLGGLTISFFVESQSRGSAPAAVKAFDGSRITQLNLTPRLVAKLLTESYKYGVSALALEFQAGGPLAGNPIDLTTDPDFLAANPAAAGNPAFKDLFFVNGIPDALSPLNPSDATAELWQWVNADKDARAFLDGTPDPFGMVVNPSFAKIALPRPDIPKLDPFCQQFPPPQPKLCTLDYHPYAASMHAAGRAAARGDLLQRVTWRNDLFPPVYGTTPSQPAGKRAILAITDAATAYRYGLQTAYLRNASGAFVGPTQAGMLAAAGSMKPVDGLAIPDPATTDPGAYPLTTLTYAATTPAALTTVQGHDYAALLDYAAGAGQTPGVGPGQLPPGYAPLPLALRAQTSAAAQQVRALAGIPIPTSAAPSSSAPAPSSTSPSPSHTVPYSLPPTTSPTGQGAGGPGQTLEVIIPPNTNGLPSKSGSTSQAAGGVITPKPSSAAPAAKAGPATPLTPLGVIRYIFLVLLIAGGALTMAGPLLRVWANKIPRRAIPPGVHLD